MKTMYQLQQVKMNMHTITNIKSTQHKSLNSYLFTERKCNHFKKSIKHWWGFKEISTFKTININGMYNFQIWMLKASSLGKKGCIYCWSMEILWSFLQYKFLQLPRGEEEGTKVKANLSSLSVEFKGSTYALENAFT